ncbi:MAG: radical SAM protein [Halodesulfurarchaeum sp.]
MSLYHRTEQYPSKYSLGAMRLASYLLTLDGVDVSILPYHLRSDPADVATDILSADPDIVGLSAYLWTADSVREICAEIRARDAQPAVIVGGPEAQKLDFDQWPEQVLYTATEGEKPLEWLIDLKRERGSIDVTEIDLHRAVFTPSRMGAVKTSCSGPVPVGEPLFSPDFLEVLGDDFNTEFVWYDTQIGCLFDCGFCGHKLREGIAKRPAEIVEQEIKNIGRIGFDRAFVIDPILGAVPGRDLTVLTWFRDYAPGTSLRVYFRPELLHDNAIEALADLDVTEVITGLQTLNPDVPVWVRETNIETAKERIELLSRQSFPNRVELIVGLPGDDYGGLRHSIEYVIDELKPTRLMAYRLTVIAGTELASRIRDPDSPTDIETNEEMQAVSSRSYSAEEMDRMLRYATAITSLYNCVQGNHDGPSYGIDVSFAEFDDLAHGALNRVPEVFADYDNSYARQFWNGELDTSPDEIRLKFPARSFTP